MRDLSILRGMPLQRLAMTGTPIADLSPLKELPLQELWCDFKPERDTELLKSIKTLKSINGKPVADFWKEFEEKQKGKKADQ